MTENLYKSGAIKKYPSNCGKCFYFDAFYRRDRPAGIPQRKNTSDHKIITNRWINVCRYTARLQPIHDPGQIADHCRLMESD